MTPKRYRKKPVEVEAVQGPGVHIVHIPLIAQTVTLTGDPHAPDTGTPVYDQLLKEVATDE